MSVNDKLLEAIRGRTIRKTPFGHGILTADMHVRRMLDCVGLQTCYDVAATAKTSFDDVLQKAARTLVYGNPEMEMEEKGKLKLPEGAELPKNTLMVFRHVLTSSQKDRDGDILHSEGAEVDPKMLLLWQHVHTLPIGKMLGVVKQNTKKLVLVSAIVDVNELAHDAATMIDNDMGRFSHGFRALEFEPIKGGDDEEIGYDVKRFEIMEESLVSVPANPDAETEDVMLSMVEDGKLISPVMREYGKTIREKRPIQIPVKLDLKVSVNGQEVKSDANESRVGEEAGGKAAGTSTPKEADGESGQAKAAGNEEMKSPWGSDFNGSWEWASEKLSRGAKSFLKKNGVKLAENDWVCLTATYPKKAILSHEQRKDDQVTWYEAEWEMKDGEPVFKGRPTEIEVEVTTRITERMTNRIDVKTAMAVIISDATKEQRKKLLEVLGVIEHREEQVRRIKEYRVLTGAE